MTSGLLFACSQDNSNQQVESEPVKKAIQEETLERRTGHLTGAATLATLKIYKPDIRFNTKFELSVDTIDRDDCFKAFENKEPWMSYCTHAQKEKKQVTITGTIPQIPAGGEEAYGGAVQTKASNSKSHAFVILPSSFGTLAVRSATESDRELIFEDPTLRFDDSENKVKAAKEAIKARRQ